MSQEVYHIPALLSQVIEGLNIKPEGIYVDATFGGGGHSRAIVELLDADKGGHLYSFDQDDEAVARAFSDLRFTIVHGNFRYINNFLRYYKAGVVDGILADLGVSFHHFDSSERGFSFRFENSPLDMRMNRKAKRSAAQVVNTYSEERLTQIFKLYGELKNARAFASRIVAARTKEPITTIDALLNAVSPLISPKKEKKELAQVFQALRIEVNNELDVLRRFLNEALKSLAPGGRLVIITYHSLEDRLVKNFMKTGNIDGQAEKDFYGRNLSPLKLITTKAITPTDDEIERNPRSRSAKLRIAEKL